MSFKVRIGEDFAVECETVEELTPLYLWWAENKQRVRNGRPAPSRDLLRPGGLGPDPVFEAMKTAPSHPKAAPLLRYLLNAKTVRVKELIVRFELEAGRALGPIMSSISTWAAAQSMKPEDVVIRRKEGKARFWDAGKRLEEAVGLLPNI